MTSPLRSATILLPLFAAVSLAQAAPGDLDPSFSPVEGSSIQLAQTADGKVLGLGDYDGSLDSVGISLVRYNTDGSVDGSFSAPYSDFTFDARHFHVGGDGKIVVAGGILKDRSTSDVLTRLLPDGARDGSFDMSDAVSNTTDFVIQKDNKIIVNTGAAGDASFRTVFTRLNVDGSLDKSYDEPDGFLSSVPTDLKLQKDGQLVIIGNFAELNSSSTGFTSFGIARLRTDGSFDPSFQRTDAADPSQSLNNVLAIQADGKFVVGASDRTLKRYNADGSYDGSFAVTFADSPDDPSHTVTFRRIVAQRDGKIIVGGKFGSVNGVTRNNIVRLNADGSVDETFHSPAEFAPRLQAIVLDVVEQADGGLLVGGTLYSVNVPGSSATKVYGLVRLLNDDTGTTNPPTGKTADLQGSLSKVKIKASADKVMIKTKLTITNTEAKKVKGITASAYLSDDDTFKAAEDTFLRSVDLRAIGKLGKNKPSEPIVVKIKLPADAEITGKYLLVVLDPDNTIEESDETNNVVVAGPLE